MVNIFAAARSALTVADPDTKINQVEALSAALQEARLSFAEISVCSSATLEPGRPERPLLVHPRQLKRRRLDTEQGRCVLIHALAHIEFNAINLALDAIQRFPRLPAAYYSDWLQVAAEEAYHFSLLRNRLHELGHDYGDFPAHDGLWDMARRTAHDPLVRMALVPRVLEARGLDVTPGMIKKLQQVNDTATVAILEIILRDEIKHVAIGSHWFNYLCEQRNLPPATTFTQLIKEYFNGELRGPFNHTARTKAGFSRQELNRLARL